MENKLFTEARRIKYVFDLCGFKSPFEDDKNEWNELDKILFKKTSEIRLYEMAMESMDLGFDSLAVLEWLYPKEFNAIVKMAVEKYDLKVIYFGTRTCDFIDNLEMYMNLGFRVVEVLEYKLQWRERRKVLKLVR